MVHLALDETSEDGRDLRETVARLTAERDRLVDELRQRSRDDDEATVFLVAEHQRELDRVRQAVAVEIDELRDEAARAWAYAEALARDAEEAARERERIEERARELERRADESTTAIARTRSELARRAVDM